MNFSLRFNLVSFKQNWRHSIDVKVCTVVIDRDKRIWILDMNNQISLQIDHSHLHKEVLSKNILRI